MKTIFLTLAVQISSGHLPVFCQIPESVKNTASPKEQAAMKRLDRVLELVSEMDNNVKATFVDAWFDATNIKSPGYYKDKNSPLLIESDDVNKYSSTRKIQTIITNYLGSRSFAKNKLGGEKLFLNNEGPTFNSIKSELRKTQYFLRVSKTELEMNPELAKEHYEKFYSKDKSFIERSVNAASILNNACIKAIDHVEICLNKINEITQTVPQPNPVKPIKSKNSQI